MTGALRGRSGQVAAAVRRRVAHRAGEARRTAQDAIAGVQRRVPAGAVALTFDDGPHPGSTDLVLDELARLRVVATFFCVGENAARHPELVHRIRSEGHAVGSHSQTHPHPRGVRLTSLRGDYVQGRRSVSAALGTDAPLFRPPHGHLSPASALMVRRRGVRTWLWTVDPQDWRPGVTAPGVAAVAGRARSGDVVLLHDWVEQPLAPEALDRSATIGALPEIVSAIRGRGLALVSLEP